MSKLFLLFTLYAIVLPLFAADHCVVLQYHHFSDQTPRITSVTPDQFDRHLDYLLQNEYQVMPLREVVDAIKAGGDLPDKCVSLSVDDAYRSVFENAYPRIKALGWPMTVFVNTEPVDQGSDSFMTWDQMREMSGHGISFENHGHQHDHMIRMKIGEGIDEWLRRATDNIDKAQQRIYQELGDKPQLFAYPYGEFRPELQKVVVSLGLSGFGQQSGPVGPGMDNTALPRFPMAAQYAEMPGFITKINSLPMPISRAEPADPLLHLDEWRPVLTLYFDTDMSLKGRLQCFVNGSSDVSLEWAGDVVSQVNIKPNFDLTPGRNRTNCTMSSGIKGRYHWYSHNWIRRGKQGEWYTEY